jgi:hypothetical protein
VQSRDAAADDQKTCLYAIRHARKVRTLSA